MNEQKIFFSYARADASAFTLQLANDLRNAGANVWIDQLDIRGGEKYNVAIEQALASSTHLLFVVTQKSIASEYVLDEVYYALDEKKVVIPVITHEAKLPFRLRGLQQISFVDNYENGLHKLLRSLHLTPVRPEEARDPNTPAPVSSAPVRQEAVTETTPPQAAEEDLLWKRALSHPTVTAYRAYLEKYPKGKYRQKALAALHQE
jgi:hypothetical protein